MVSKQKYETVGTKYTDEAKHRLLKTEFDIIISKFITIYSIDAAKCMASWQQSAILGVLAVD